MSNWLNESYPEMNRQVKLEEEQAHDFKFRCIHCRDKFYEEDLNEKGECQECEEIEEKHKND